MIDSSYLSMALTSAPGQDNSLSPLLWLQYNIVNEYVLLLQECVCVCSLTSDLSLLAFLISYFQFHFLSIHVHLSPIYQHRYLQMLFISISFGFCFLPSFRNLISRLKRRKRRRLWPFAFRLKLPSTFSLYAFASKNFCKN